MDYEAAAAKLASPHASAAAESEGIVWGTIKGYPPWPAQIVSQSWALKDAALASARPARGGDVVLQFFGDASTAWWVRWG